MLMDGDFTIVEYDEYLDGGTEEYIFSDGVVICRDYRLGTTTAGAFYAGYPDLGIMALIYGKRRKLIDTFKYKDSREVE